MVRFYLVFSFLNPLLVLITPGNSKFEGVWSGGLFWGMWKIPRICESGGDRRKWANTSLPHSSLVRLAVENVKWTYFIFYFWKTMNLIFGKRRIVKLHKHAICPCMLPLGTSPPHSPPCNATILLILSFFSFTRICFCLFSPPYFSALLLIFFKTF